MARTPRWPLLLGALVGALPAAVGPWLTEDGRRARALALMDVLVAPRQPVSTVDVDTIPEGALLVDARTPEEQAVSTLPGAMPLDAFAVEPIHDRPVVFFCTVGVRSHDVAARWAERGVDAHNLRGSLIAWTHAGRPLITPDGRPTRRLHTWSRSWALQADGYEPTW
jgi:rhodanese-related sulfurtransferase